MAAARPKGRLLHPRKGRRTEQLRQFERAVGHRFDETTGQMYTETMMSIQSGDDTNWAQQLWKRAVPLNLGKVSNPVSKVERKFKAHPKEVEPKPGVRRGARSLQDLAIASIIQNLPDCPLDVLQCLPIPMVQRVWEDRRFDSFHGWKMCSKILSQTKIRTLEHLRHTEVIQHPKSPLEVYLKPLTSPTFDFITSLSITTRLPVPDLVKLSRCTNIGVLEIINTEGEHAAPSSVTDWIVRAWCISALEEGAFKVLRILRLLNHKELSARSLLYLNAFPALATYEVGGCGFDRNAKIEARNIGWQPTVEKVLPHLERACAERLSHLQVSLGFQESPVTLPSVKEPPWDQALSTLFERVGELRNNSDLQRAGVNVGHPIFMEQGLTTPIPIASLSLGRGGFLERSYLAFLRIKLPPQDQTKNQSSTKPAVEVKRAPENQQSNSSAPTSRKQPSKLNRNKKRKLDDVLSSFT